MDFGHWGGPCPCSALRRVLAPCAGHARWLPSPAGLVSARDTRARARGGGLRRARAASGRGRPGPGSSCPRVSGSGVPPPVWQRRGGAEASKASSAAPEAQPSPRPDGSRDVSHLSLHPSGPSWVLLWVFTGQGGLHPAGQSQVCGLNAHVSVRPFKKNIGLCK